jgi:cell division protein FtsB
VWNKICVNRLAVEVNDLQNQYQKIVNVNEIMKAEINKKSSLERIEKISIGQLNLTYAKEQPIWFEVDGEPR